MRTFQFSDARSHKFWQIEVSGKSLTVTYGPIGSAGQAQTKTFATPEKARVEADKLIREKLKKGYVETSSSGWASDADGFEAALRENPHDAAAWSAYADYLAERGDPRGEFMQVQLALEDESLAKAERAALRKRERQLLKAHRRDWLGPALEAALYGTDPPPRGLEVVFRRGWLWEVGGVAFDDEDYGPALYDALPAAREARLLHSLHVESAYETDLAPLAAATFAPTLRRLRIGEEPTRTHTRCDGLPALVNAAPRLETLVVNAHRTETGRLFATPMPALRELQVNCCDEYPLDRLAKNKSLTNLRELHCHPHAQEPGDEPYIRLPQLRALCRSKVLTSLTHLQLRLADFGDKGVEEIVKSGLLKRLKVLDLRHGLVTDDGAEALSESPDLKNLDFLDLSWNRLTNWGVATLKRTGVKASLAPQQLPNTESQETFCYGDYE